MHVIEKKHAEISKRSPRMGNAWCPNRANRVLIKFVFTPCNIEITSIVPREPISVVCIYIYIVL